jgi:DNA polymerase/3'-5' exonuclease PolX
MRRYALTLGYTLNEHTITPVREDAGEPPEMETEKDIFDFLGLKYVEPQDRLGEAAIQPKPKVATTTLKLKKTKKTRSSRK